MKIYVVVKNDYEYNDEYWYQPEGEGYTALKGYNSKDAAILECARLNEKDFDPEMISSEYDKKTDESLPVTDLYKVVTLEVEDTQ